MNHQHLLRSPRNTTLTRLKVCQDTPAAALIQLSVASSRGVRDKDEEEEALKVEDGDSLEENKESVPGGEREKWGILAEKYGASKLKLSSG